MPATIPESTWPPAPFRCPSCDNRPAVDGGHKKSCAYEAKRKRERTETEAAARIRSRRTHPANHDDGWDQSLRDGIRD